MAQARKRYTTTITRKLRQLDACSNGLSFVKGKTFDQAWECCPDASYYIWWVRMVWKQWPALRDYYFVVGHPVATKIVIDALNFTQGSAEQNTLQVAANEAPTFLRRAFRLTAKRWARDQGLRVTRKGWKI